MEAGRIRLACNSNTDDDTISRLLAGGELLRQEKYVEAVGVFRCLAEEGVASAQYNMGSFFLRGLGTEYSPAEAFSWYLRSAYQGFVPAMFRVGMLLESGCGVAVDLFRARDWYARAAEQSHPASEYRLALMHRDGRGVEPDRRIALELALKAARRGYASAQLLLSELLCGDAGGMVEPAEMEFWLSRGH